MTNHMKILALCALVSNLAWCDRSDIVAPPGSRSNPGRGVWGQPYGGYGFGGPGGYGFGGPGGYGGGFGGGGFGGGGGGGFGGGGGGGGGSSSRSATEEIGKLGEEASKEIKENQKQFLSSQEKSMQSFYNSLKETQVKDDGLKLLEDLNQDGSGVHGTGEEKSSISSITDKIIQDISDNEQQRMKTFEAIGQMLIRPQLQPQSVRQTAAQRLTSFSGRASTSPLGDLMGISAQSHGPSRPENPDYQEQGGVVDNGRGIRSKFLYNPPDLP